MPAPIPQPAPPIVTPTPPPIVPTPPPPIVVRPPAWTVWTTSEAEKVRLNDPPRDRGNVALYGARNEFVSFQIVVRGPATNVRVQRPIPSIVPAENVHLFREDYIYAFQPSGPDGVTGWWPDALVPDIDDVVGEQRNAFPFTVAAGENRTVWVEFHIPENAKSGTFTTTIKVAFDGGSATIPVALTVWNFGLPSTSTLRSWFSLYYPEIPAGHHVTGDFSALRARYSQLALDHRISVAGFDDGDSSPDHLAAAYGALLDGTAPTQLKGARLTSITYGGPSSSLPAWIAVAKKRGWFDRMFDYTCDEPPGGTCTWAQLKDRVLAAKRAGLPSLVTTTIQELQEYGGLDGVSILVPLINFMNDKPGRQFSGGQAGAYDAWKKQPGHELWLYQSCMSTGCGDPSSYFSGWTSYAIAKPSVRARQMGWLLWEFGATGELYWDSAWAYSMGDPWSNQWSFNENGSGTFFYPGTPDRISGKTDIPLASIRLKQMRAGYQDYEYLHLLDTLGGTGWPEATKVSPNPYTQGSAEDFIAAHDAIGARINDLATKAALKKPKVKRPAKRRRVP